MVKELSLLVAIVLTGVAVVCDLRTREIPDWVSVAIACVGIGALAFVPWPAGIWMALSGCLISSAAGIAMFWTGGFGGGDAKLLSALGLVLGPKGAVIMLAAMAISGGVLALIARARGQTTFAYGPAIGIGVLTQALLDFGAHR